MLIRIGNDANEYMNILASHVHFSEAGRIYSLAIFSSLLAHKSKLTLAILPIFSVPEGNKPLPVERFNCNPLKQVNLDRFDIYETDSEPKL